VRSDIIGNCEKSINMKMCLTLNVYRDIAVGIYRYKSDTRNKQDRQCTYSVTLRRVRATVVAVGKQ